MTDKVQKIRDEVERLKSQLLRGACSSQIVMETMCKEEAYNEVLAILDTMQKEPVSEELEGEADKYSNEYDNYFDVIVTEYDGTEHMVDDKMYVKDAFKAGAKWQKQKDSMPVSENLEEASFDYAEACKYDGGEKLLCVEHFRAGAEWQKEQMIKDATEVTVHIDAGGYPYIPQMELYDYDKDMPLAKEGDMYKVILIKED